VFLEEELAVERGKRRKMQNKFAAVTGYGSHVKIQLMIHIYQ